MTEKLAKEGLIFPELSYRVIGCAFDVFNEIGYGHSEAHSQKALAIAFKRSDLSFKEQVYFPLKYDGEIVAKGFCDFVVEDKIIIELKKNERFSISHINQVNQYLRAGNLKLAIIMNFSPKGVMCKRIVNILPKHQ
jgi:GxxExxY protein